ncbi:MAG: threonine--tRNA ligase, partial [Candidatus Woesearchaeota archaeon]|nr:threonine--tRNA ligase [Candidatus Woesearchaeota archaeon]
MDISTLRHSASHVMAQAVKMLFPKVKFGIGPAIDDGFYYDFDNVKFTPEDLKKIEQKMNEIIKKDLPFKKEIVTKEKAKKLFKDQPYKLELLKEMKDPITIYQQGDFIDLCAGPHINSSGQIKAFKLLNIAGAYWKGSEKNKMLQRIYGTAFPTQKELDEHVKKLEEIQKNDHRILGKELGLFVFSDLVGKGLPLLTPKGTTIRRELEKFVIDEELKRGYLHVITPDLARVKLYEISGHYPYYKNTMYPVMKVDEEKLILRPMTCP